MPAAGPPGTPPSLVRLNAGCEKEVIRVVAIREGAWPIVPKASDLLPNRTYLRGSRKMTGPVSLGGNRSAYGCELVLEYAVDVSEGLDGPAPLGGLPWRNKVGLPTVNEVVPAEYFREGLISSQYQQPQGIWLPETGQVPPLVPDPSIQPTPINQPPLLMPVWPAGSP